MLKIYFTIILLFIFSGCVGREGVSLKYYNDCEEYYDMQGYYHKKCDDNMMLKYKTIKDAFKEDKKESNNQNVW